jgi:hypothetical protein
MKQHDNKTIEPETIIEYGFGLTRDGEIVVMDDDKQKWREQATPPIQLALRRLNPVMVGPAGKITFFISPSNKELAKVEGADGSVKWWPLSGKRPKSRRPETIAQSAKRGETLFDPSGFVLR